MDDHDSQEEIKKIQLNRFKCDFCEFIFTTKKSLQRHNSKRPKNCSIMKSLIIENQKLRDELEVAKNNQTINKRAFYVNKVPIEQLIPNKEDQEMLHKGACKLMRYIERVTIAGMRDEVMNEYEFFIDELIRDLRDKKSTIS